MELIKKVFHAQAKVEVDKTFKKKKAKLSVEQSSKLKMQSRRLAEAELKKDAKGKKKRGKGRKGSKQSKIRKTQGTKK